MVLIPPNLAFHLEDPATTNFTMFKVQRWLLDKAHALGRPREDDRPRLQRRRLRGEKETRRGGKKVVLFTVCTSKTGIAFQSSTSKPSIPSRGE
jgi:hypothetical protein